MRYLVLNRTPLTTGLRFPDWIGTEDEAVLLTDTAAVSTDPRERTAQLAGYVHVEFIDDFHFNPLVESLALAMHRRSAFDRVLALSEFDILRAARLRELFGAPGQDVACATAFRDKLEMKRILSGAGVPLARYAPVSNLADLVGFVESNGYPIVVKPRRGGGSMDVHVLRGEQDIDPLLASHRDLGTDDGAQLIAEQYIEHELLHVDGIVLGGEIRLLWASTQGDSTCLDIKEGHALHSCLMDPEDELLAPAQELTRRALAALPTPDTSIFHAEIFLTGDGRMVFNEVASRMGGGMIEDVLKLGFGVFLPEVMVRFLSGHQPLDVPAAPLRIAGLSLFPPRPGTLVEIPEECPVPGITQYRRYAEPGTELALAKLSVEKIGAVLATGDSRKEVEAALLDAQAWFERSTVIRPTGEPDLAP
ncbi:ATP-grasp domain-containing protein [Streptomyces sp. NBC_01218]|uniref:ATP-grasp domain-containing protein n=1 Tax=unclassified Streptomyces TaxID=2593676 RepID=UPI0023B968AA|nr:MULTISPECIES: ATP-grasp domain-containing protein [unclassified Streptomyces]WEH39575.1 ATP-grasp domain-containing protein [Streptomyces sp. AM 2-1-1]WSQ51268.1 ATP-grasp domain-containing protein [Streptomyces sp. NBC_01218]